MHVGIDTVALKGEGFEAQVEAGGRVEAGAPLIRFDLDVVARRAPSLVTPVLVTNGERFEIVRRLLGRSVAQGELLMELRAIDVATRATTATDTTTVGLRLRVPLPHGIHARPAALIARRLRDFDARVTVTAHGRRASAASAVSLMSLGVRHGDEIGLEAAGADAQAALAAVAALLEGEHGGAERRAGDRRRQSKALRRPPRDRLRGTRCRASSHRVASRSGPRPSSRAPSAASPRWVRVPRTSLPSLPARAMRCGSGSASWRPASRARGARSPRRTWSFSTTPICVAAAAESIARGESAGHAWRSAVRASIAALRDLGDTLLAERADDLLRPGIAGARGARRRDGERGGRASRARDRARRRAPALATHRARRGPHRGHRHGARRRHLACRDPRSGDGQADAGGSGRGDSRDRARNAPLARRRARQPAGRTAARADRRGRA